LDKLEQFITLVIKEYEGTLTSEEFLFLQECLKEDSQLLDFYLNCYLTISIFNKAYDFSDCVEWPQNDLTDIDGPLWKELSVLEKMAPSLEIPKPAEERPREVIEKLDVEKPPRTIRKSSVVTAIVSSAALLFFVILIRFFPAPAVRTPIGKVLHLNNAVFARHLKPVAEGQDVFAGPLALTDGSVLIELDTGTRLFLTAPIEIELFNKSLVCLESGKLLAQVTPSGLGFTVDTPHGSVVVYGTEFTLAVDPHGGTRVEVFKGRVNLSSKSAMLSQVVSCMVAAGQVGKVDISGVIYVEDDRPQPSPVRRSLERVWAGTQDKALWKNPANWENGQLPDPYSPAFLQNCPVRSICVIDDSHTGSDCARAEYINIGLWGYGCLEMTGGRLETEEIWVGRRDGGDGVFTLTGGTVIITEKRDGIIIGKSWEKKAGHGVMNLRGGTILFKDPQENMILGWGYPAQGVLNMEGGRLSIPNQLILGAVSDEIQSPEPLLGTGYVNLKAGILRAGSLLIRQGRVTIQDGVLVLKGDVRQALQDEIMKKRVIAEDESRPLRLDYDPTTDETRIYADAAP
jgi:hypothetical protein